MELKENSHRLPPFGRNVMFTYFRHGERAKYEIVEPALICAGGPGEVVRLAAAMARRARDEGVYFIFPGGIPPDWHAPLRVAFDRAGGERGPLWDHVLTGDIEEARGLAKAGSRKEEVGGDSTGVPQAVIGNAEPPDSQSPIPTTLTKRVGQGRNGAAVFAKGDGFEVEFGAWSHAKGRILSASEELTAAKCRFREANPRATYMQRSVYAEAYQPISGRFEAADSGALLAGLVRVVGRYDAIVIVSPEAVGVGVELAAALGPDRVFLPPPMGLSHMSAVED